MLISQSYSSQDDRAQIEYLAPALSHPDYSRVLGRPLFLIFSASHFPDAARRIESIRTAAREILSEDLYICTVRSSAADVVEPGVVNANALVDFQPDRADTELIGSLKRTAPGGKVDIVLYQDLVSAAVAKNAKKACSYPCLSPGWDNTARKGVDGLVVHGSTPDLYGEWLETTLVGFRPKSPTENLVFVNAWNDWAEGCYLEPDTVWGRSYLEAHKSARDRIRGRMTLSGDVGALGRLDDKR
jgi:hypothetical protein